jgi:hypothetical protein
MSQPELLDLFFDYIDEHEDATDGLTLETAMTLWAKNEGVTVSESIDFGYDILSLFAAGFAAFVEANEDISIPGLFEEFASNYCLSEGMMSQLANTIIEAVEADDEEGIIQHDADDSEEAHEARTRAFLTKLLQSVPNSFAPYFLGLRRFGRADYLGNVWDGGVEYALDDPRNRHFRKGVAVPNVPSVYHGHPIVSVSEEELDEHWFHHSDVGDYSIHQGAGIHGGMWAAREKGRGGHRDLHTFSGKNAKQAATEHAEISTAAKYQALSEGLNETDMLLGTGTGSFDNRLDRSLHSQTDMARECPTELLKRTKKNFIRQAYARV